jgi:hypothetical protein
VLVQPCCTRHYQVSDKKPISLIKRILFHRFHEKSAEARCLVLGSRWHYEVTTASQRRRHCEGSILSWKGTDGQSLAALHPLFGASSPVTICLILRQGKASWQRRSRGCLSSEKRAYNPNPPVWYGRKTTHQRRSTSTRTTWWRSGGGMTASSQRKIVSPQS